jgi:hypothetical protein
MYDYEDIISSKIKDRETDLYINYRPIDRIDSLAYKYYKDSSLYWIILLANGCGSDLDIDENDLLRIPMPLRSVIKDLYGG